MIVWLFQFLALWVLVGSGKDLLVEGFQAIGSYPPTLVPSRVLVPQKEHARLGLEQLATLGLSGYNSLRSAELRGTVEFQDSSFIYLCLNFKALCIPL